MTELTEQQMNALLRVGSIAQDASNDYCAWSDIYEPIEQMNDLFPDGVPERAACPSDEQRAILDAVRRNREQANDELPPPAISVTLTLFLWELDRALAAVEKGDDNSGPL